MKVKLPLYLELLMGLLEPKVYVNFIMTNKIRNITVSFIMSMT